MQFSEMRTKGESALRKSVQCVNLLVRESSHAEWLDAFEQYVVSGARPPVLSTGDKCALRDWFVSPEMLAFAADAPEVARLLHKADKLHRGMQAQVSVVNALVEQGQREEAELLFKNAVSRDLVQLTHALAQLRAVLEQSVLEDQHVYEKTAANFNTFLFLVFCSALCIGMAAALLLSRSLSAPLCRIAEVTGQVQAGKLSARVRMERGDEAGRIAATLDTMLDVLTAKIKEADEKVNEVVRMDGMTRSLNKAASGLLLSDMPAFDNSVCKALANFGRAAGVDRVYIWAIRQGDDARQYADRIYEWTGCSGATQDTRPAQAALEGETWRTLMALFAQDRCLNVLVRELQPVDKDVLGAEGIVSLLLAPIHMDDELWGFIGFDNCRDERTWSVAEEDILRTAGLLMMAAIRRHNESSRILAAKEEAESATRAKSDFLAHMSHEIRTPMNAILGIAYLALQKNMSAEEHEYFSKIQRAANALLGVLNDILDFSKIEARRLEIDHSAFSLRDNMRSVADVLSVRALEKGIHLAMRVTSETPDAFMGDALRLRQVLLNLAGNAIKFTDTGGVHIEVEALDIKPREATLHFAVLDTGIGMSQHALAILFQPFSQTDNSITRRYGGTGLGLAISKELVEMMGGHMRVQSMPDVGSEFSFTLTLPRAKEERIVPADVVLDPAPRFDGKRVLLVEDNDINRMIAQTLLEQVGISVGVAENGAEAVQAVQAGPYDLVLMDIQMPVMDGLEATQSIRAIPGEASSVPIVAMTAHAMSSDYDRSLQAGMNDHITKPIDPTHLYVVLARWMP